MRFKKSLIFIFLMFGMVFFFTKNMYAIPFDVSPVGDIYTLKENENNWQEIIINDKNISLNYFINYQWENLNMPTSTFIVDRPIKLTDSNNNILFDDYAFYIWIDSYDGNGVMVIDNYNYYENLLSSFGSLNFTTKEQEQGNSVDFPIENILHYKPSGSIDGNTTIHGLEYSYYHGGQLFKNGDAITSLNSFEQDLDVGEKYLFMFSNSAYNRFHSSGFAQGVFPFNLNYIIVDLIDKNNWVMSFYDYKDTLVHTLENVYLDNPIIYVPIELTAEYAYDIGLNNGRQDGYDKGYDDGLDDGFDKGYDDGLDAGYNKGINENVETGGFGMILASAFTALGALLSIQLLPNISIGAIVAIPIVFGVVMFIIGRRKE